MLQGRPIGEMRIFGVLSSHMGVHVTYRGRLSTSHGDSRSKIGFEDPRARWWTLLPMLILSTACHDTPFRRNFAGPELRPRLAYFGWVMVIGFQLAS